MSAYDRDAVVSYSRDRGYTASVSTVSVLMERARSCVGLTLGSRGRTDRGNGPINLFPRVKSPVILKRINYISTSPRAPSFPSIPVIALELSLRKSAGG